MKKKTKPSLKKEAGGLLYYYGAAYIGKNKKIVPFCVKTKEKIPESAIELKFIIASHSETAHSLAEKLVKEVTPGQIVLSKEEIAEVISQSPEPVEPIKILAKELGSGSVVTHEDNKGHHFAIVLNIDGNDADLLFLSSKEFGRKYRAATKEELALAGFAYSRKTYLCLVNRPITELYPRNLDFPKHRVQDLIKEFINC